VNLHYEIASREEVLRFNYGTCWADIDKSENHPAKRGEALEEEARADRRRHVLVRAGIADGAAMRQVFAPHEPDAVMHLSPRRMSVVRSTARRCSSRPMWSALHAARGRA
jgi:hypothetical protein